MVCHRDIKPENLLVIDHQNTKVRLTRINMQTLTAAFIFRL